MREQKPPKGVVQGVFLLSAALLLSILRGVAGLEIEGPGGIQLSLVFMAAVPVLSFSLFLLWKIYQGREWARITQLLLFTFSLISGLGETAARVREAPYFFGLYVTETLLIIGAFVLLFQRTSSQWFVER